MDDRDDMRAALLDRHGPPGVLYEGRVPVPSPGPGEVLVRVHAASVNGGDLPLRAGRLRAVSGRRFPQRTGMDFAGEVAAVDAAVRGLDEGTPVWGMLRRGRLGSAAEYVAVRPRQLALAPAGIPLEEAAALPAVGATAITALRDRARLRPGERLLVRGASGGVGSVAVQLGKAIGAHVTGIAGPRNLDLVRALGADEAVDRTGIRPSDLGRFDVVLDTVGTGLSAYRALLAPGGRMVAIALDFDRPLPSAAAVLASAVHGRRRVRLFSADPGHELFAALTRYAEAGDLRPVVDTVRPLADIAAAHRALEGGGVRGKHVVRIG
jgi:NADPH:quinone reductase-like Zn-dependent oxidoreductase